VVYLPKSLYFHIGQCICPITRGLTPTISALWEAQPGCSFRLHLESRFVSEEERYYVVEGGESLLEMEAYIV
jgi:hypothetical protein